MRQQLYQSEILLFIQKSHTKYVGDPQSAYLRGLPLSAVTASLHYLPRYLRSIIILHAAKRILPWLEVHLRRFFTMLLLRNKDQ